ncbi:MAG: sulfite reductase subunit alpha [Gordonia sp. (in: high G+C Gram-positive bacteria)]
MQIPYIPSDIGFTGEQRAWLAGFLAGLNTRMAMPQGAATGITSGPVAEVSAGAPLLIVYGTQTGNAEFVADAAKVLAAEHGLEPRVYDTADLDIAVLAAAPRVLVAVSTYGEGDMPDDAEDFWQALAAADAPRLDGVHYGVVALGDSIYDDFCQAGKNIDARLAELGATRVIDRADCDVDFQQTADEWMRRAIPALAATGAGAVGAPAPEIPASGDSPATNAPSSDTPVVPVVGAAPAKSAAKSGKSAWGRKNPYPATVVANTVLSGPGSDKEVRHIVISLGDSGIVYEPGDGISIAPVNDPALVELVIERLGVSGDTLVTDRKEQRTLRETLSRHYEIATPSKYLLDHIATRSGDPELKQLVSNGDQSAIDAWLWGKDVLDLLNVNPTLTISPDELIGELRPLANRVYSISSSPRTHVGTVHLTMAAVRYRSGERDRGGVCSTYLADRVTDGTTVDVFITPNKSFRLPADDNAKVIMVGPGTGIAPFRAFLHDRAERGASGANWLFFGDQHAACDHIYADEINQFVADGVLNRLDLAFSRDQEHKIYVQDRMREHGADIFGWLEDGAYLYVCGDATRMARDVEDALHDIVAEHGGVDTTAAAEYLSRLKKDKRYLRDVY